MTIKILTYNVHKLFDITGRKYFLSSLKEILADMDLDIVFLQELPGFLHQNIQSEFNADPLEHLADNLWEHFVYGKNAITSAGDHGNAILSKFPFLISENHNISNHPLEQRGFLHGIANINGVEVMMGCTHLDLTSIGRRRQIAKIEKVIKDGNSMDVPFIFCGDFNDWTGRTTKLVKKMGFESAPGLALPTFPSFFPFLSLDRIFFRNIQCTKLEVLKDNHWKKLSDHLPMYAEFMLDGI